MGDEATSTVRGSDGTPALTCSPEQARAFVTRLYRAAGVPGEYLPVLADYYTEMSLQGADAHALWMLPRHVGDILRGKVKATPSIRILSPEGPCTTLEGDNGPGIVVAARAMNEATERASLHGVGSVAVHGGNHFAAATYYAEIAIKRKQIGIVLSNAVGGHMAHWGAGTPLIANNPLAIGVPAGRQMPLIIDIAMSAVGRGKILQAAEEGWESIPLSWAMDKSGRPVTNPQAAARSLLRPMGEHKGSGLAVVIGTICSALTGANVDNRMSIESLEPRNTGHLMIAIDPGQFGPVSEFLDRVDRWIETLYGAEPAEGFLDFHLPGHGKLKIRKQRLREGIPVTPALKKKLDQLAVELNAAGLT